MKTYSSAPFISHDGKDENGVRAEVKVTLGFGNISDIEESKNGVAKKIIFSVDNTKYLISGWSRSDEIIKLAEKARSNEEPIHFRIEVRRKDNIDRTEPIDDLATLARAKDSIVKSLAAVKLEGEEWVFSTDAVTNPKEDPKQGGLYSANDMDEKELNTSSSNSGNNNNRSHHSTNEEPPPYVTFDRDGNLLPGSIAVSVPLNIFSYVKEWNRSHEDEAIDDTKIDIVVRALLSASNELQMRVNKKLTKPNLASGSHTRARALIFEVIRSFYPITPEVVASKKSLLEWRNNLIEKGHKMWLWSMDEVEKIYDL